MNTENENQKKKEAPEGFCFVEEAARRLACSEETVRQKYIGGDRLPARKAGHSYLIALTDLRALEAELFEENRQRVRRKLQAKAAKTPPNTGGLG